MNKELRIKNKILISAVILAHQGAGRLTKCIKSVTWCDEIILIIDNSLSFPRTRESSKNDVWIPDRVRNDRKIKIFWHKLHNDFSAQRNFGLTKSKSNWVLFLDSDEEVSQDLASEIKNQIKRDLDSGFPNQSSGQALDGMTKERAGMTEKGMINGYFLKRQDYFLGRWLRYGETANIKILRLARKNKGKWYGKVHEVWKVDGKTGYLESPILHYSHPTVANFLKKINWYTDFLSEVWFREGRKITAWEIVFYPLFKFISNYFLKLGFLDGVPGCIMAMMMSFHSFLARSKLWLKNKNEDNR